MSLFYRRLAISALSIELENVDAQLAALKKKPGLYKATALESRASELDALLDATTRYILASGDSKPDLKSQVDTVISAWGKRPDVRKKATPYYPDRTLDTFQRRCQSFLARWEIDKQQNKEFYPIFELQKLLADYDVTPVDAARQYYSDELVVAVNDFLHLDSVVAALHDAAGSDCPLTADSYQKVHLKFRQFSTWAKKVKRPEATLVQPAKRKAEPAEVVEMVKEAAEETPDSPAATGVARTKKKKKKQSSGPVAAHRQRLENAVVDGGLNELVIVFKLMCSELNRDVQRHCREMLNTPLIPAERLKGIHLKPPAQLKGLTHYTMAQVFALLGKADGFFAAMSYGMDPNSVYPEDPDQVVGIIKNLLDQATATDNLAALMQRVKRETLEKSRLIKPLTDIIQACSGRHAFKDEPMAAMLGCNFMIGAPKSLENNPLESAIENFRQMGVDLNACSASSGLNSLMFAIKNANFARTHELLQTRCIDLSHTTVVQQNILHFLIAIIASKRNQRGAHFTRHSSKLINELITRLDGQPDTLHQIICQPDADGYTPLHFAIKAHYNEIALMLLDKRHSEPEVLVPDGGDASKWIITVAVRYGSSEMVKMCLHYINYTSAHLTTAVTLIEGYAPQSLLSYAGRFPCALPALYLALETDDCHLDIAEGESDEMRQLKRAFETAIRGGLMLKKGALEAILSRLNSGSFPADLLRDTRFFAGLWDYSPEGIRLLDAYIISEYRGGVIALSTPQVSGGIYHAEPVDSDARNWALTLAIMHDPTMIHSIYDGLGYTPAHLTTRKALPMMKYPSEGGNSLLDLAIEFCPHMVMILRGYAKPDKDSTT